MTFGRLVAAIVVLASFAAIGHAQAQIKSQWIEYSYGNAKLKSYIAYDDRAARGKRPAIFLIHRRNGMDDITLKNTEMYARLGYVVFAADIFGYGQGILPKTIPEMQAQTDIYNKDRLLMRARAQAGLDALKNNPIVDGSRIALLGYCFGGTVGVEMAYAGTPIVGLVTIHGSFRDHASEGAKNVKGKVLILHGAEDTVAPLTEVNKIVQDLRVAKVEFQYELYSGAQHGFSTPKDRAEERANIQSIAATTRFLKEVFGI